MALLSLVKLLEAARSLEDHVLYIAAYGNLSLPR